MVTCKFFVIIVANHPLNGKCRTGNIYKCASLNERNLKKAQRNLKEFVIITSMTRLENKNIRKALISPPIGDQKNI